VFLKMTGELLKPVLAFDIDLPEDRNFNVSRDIVNNVNTKLDQIRQQPSELNKQVFALLLLNRFVTENPFESSGGGMTAAGFARQSVSKLLTEQLNRLASDLIEGVDINFGVESTDDYTTGERRDRTDFNVGLSKRLLNDRLVVSVGSNFELEGPTAGNQRSNNLAGNINIDYKLSKDGRYALRAYRKNEYEGVLEGYIVETGLGFVITLDYNRFRQIFMSKAQRQQKRQIRKENREQEKKDQEKQQQENTTETSPADDRRQEVTIANANTNE
jgi:translocation and assembly module TamB